MLLLYSFCFDRLFIMTCFRTLFACACVVTIITTVRFYWTSDSTLPKIRTVAELSTTRSLAFDYHVNTATFSADHVNTSVAIVTNLTIVRNVSQSTGDSSTLINGRDYLGNPVEIAFYERFRTKWLYRKLFKPSKTKEVCNCSTAFSATKKLVYRADDVKNYDVIMFTQDVSRRRATQEQWRELNRIRSIHNPRQQWVYGTRECVRRILRVFPPVGITSSLYNMSITYHSNSTITIPYGYFASQHNAVENSQQDWAKGKDQLVAWMSSARKNRPNTWRREDFVNYLNLFMNIHMYGRSRQRQCPSNTEEDCRQTISKYKFYLSFENNCCGEYITEKFWRTLTWGVVPIVIGAPKENYLRLAPPNSFIYADDFQSAKDLADYIMLLDSNDTMYNTYHQWRENFVAVNNFPDLDSTKAITTVPQPNFVYSCQTVCKVAEKFIEGERRTTGNQVTSSYHFDPMTSWWGGSCTACGSQSWIRQFSSGKYFET